MGKNGHRRVGLVTAAAVIIIGGLGLAGCGDHQEAQPQQQQTKQVRTKLAAIKADYKKATAQKNSVARLAHLDVMQQAYRAEQRKAKPDQQVISLYQRLIKSEKDYFMAQNKATLAELTIPAKAVATIAEDELQAKMTSLVALTWIVKNERGVVYNQAQYEAIADKIEAVKKRYAQKLGDNQATEDQGTNEATAPDADQQENAAQQESAPAAASSAASGQTTTPNAVGGNGNAGAVGGGQDQTAQSAGQWTPAQNDNATLAQPDNTAIESGGAGNNDDVQVPTPEVDDGATGMPTTDSATEVAPGVSE